MGVGIDGRLLSCQGRGTTGNGGVYEGGKGEEEMSEPYKVTGEPLYACRADCGGIVRRGPGDVCGQCDKCYLMHDPTIGLPCPDPPGEGEGEGDKEKGRA